VVAANEALVRPFHPMPPVRDYGLDAVTRGANRGMLFSTEEGFFSESLGVTVGQGDLLSDRGRIVRTNAQLLANFHPLGPSYDLGLDAIIIRPRGEIWFSTEEGFVDANLGSITDGDLLSTSGYVVATNLELLRNFGPIEDLHNFGLDAVTVVVPCITSDFDHDGDVDEDDRTSVLDASSGPGVPSPDPEAGDFDGDGDVDQSDFGIWQRCASGPGAPADPDCAE